MHAFLGARHRRNQMSIAHAGVDKDFPRHIFRSRSEGRAKLPLSRGAGTRIDSTARRESRPPKCTACFTNTAIFACVAGLIFCTVISAVATAADEPLNSSIARPLERRGYEIRFLAAFDRKAFDTHTARQLLNDFDQTTRRCVGDMWSVKSDLIDWLSPVTARGLEQIDRPDLEKHYPGESADVWFLAAIEAQPVGTRVSLRAWQPEVESETSVSSIDVVDPREIPVSLLRLCRDHLRPMGVVDEINDRSVRIRLRAGEIIPPDPTFTQLSKGQILLPMFAYRNSKNVIERLQKIPWTYISVDESDESTTTGTVQSGLRVPLGGKKRGRIDTLVVALRPQHASTRIVLLSQTKPPLPLVAHRIEVRTEPQIAKPAVENARTVQDPTLLHELLTDRRGLTTVSVDPDQPLVWLFAFSGQHLLARVPFVPGNVLEARLEVPDDSTRLSAEADLQMLQGEVIDAVALRNTSMSAIRAAIKKDDWATVDQKLAVLKRQRDTSNLIDRLIAVRVAATSAAKARKDKVAEVRINRMCDETETLIKTHLSDAKLSALNDEIQALKQVAPEPKSK